MDPQSDYCYRYGHGWTPATITRRRTIRPPLGLFVGIALILGALAGCTLPTGHSSTRPGATNAAGSPVPSPVGPASDTTATEPGVPAPDTQTTRPATNSRPPWPSTSSPRPTASRSQATGSPTVTTPTRASTSPSRPARGVLSVTRPPTFSKIASNSDYCFFSFTLSNAGPGAAYGLDVDVSLSRPDLLTETYTGLFGPSTLASGASYAFGLGAESFPPGPYGVTVTATATNGSTSWRGYVTC